MALPGSDIESAMDAVMKNIYSSCDPENTNLVPAAKLIEFIVPYIQEDISAQESLKSSLDPKNENVLVSSENFYEVMNEWAKKIANSSDDEDNDAFNRTPSQLDEIDEKLLPYTQSTPRASFGQKLLSCEGLLNLSNVSGYNLSASIHTKENSTVGPERTILEEEIKRLEHQLHKVLSEMSMMKTQLAQSEELNENLHSDLERCRTRLVSEQQLNEHLQKNKTFNEELREEINFAKKRIDELNKKLVQNEKDNNYMNSYIQQLGKQNATLEERCENLVKREQDLKKDMFDIKTELDMKDHEISTISKINEELKMKLEEKKNMIEHLTNENELLDYKKHSLEKIISSRRFSSSSQYTSCLAEESGFVGRDQSGADEFFLESLLDFKNSPQISLQAELFQVNCHLATKRNMEIEEESFEDEYTNCLKVENESLPSKINSPNKENEIFSELATERIEEFQTENNKTGNKNKMIAELQQKLLQLKCDFKNLKSRHSTSENELLEYKNKFNFEAAYKNVQIELNQKNEELSALKRMYNECKEVIGKLTNTNQQLEKSLEQAKQDAKQVTAFNENTFQTHTIRKNNINEIVELNKSFETNLKKLQEDLQDKITEITQLKGILKNEEGIKNTMWRDNKELIDRIEMFTKMNQNIQDQLQKSEHLKTDYETLLSKYNEEVSRNCDLCEQITSQKVELCNINSKYKNEIDENVKLCEQITAFKIEVEHIRKNQNDDKEIIDRKLNDYESLLHSLECKIKDLESENETLKIVLDNERRQSEKYAEGGSSSECSSLLNSFEKNVPKPKMRTYEKQKLTINKLKEKLEYVELQLSSEKSICLDLREMLNKKQDVEDKLKKLKKEFDELQSISILEKQNLQNIINDISDKMKARDECYKEQESILNKKNTEQSAKLSQMEEMNRNIRFELTQKEALLKIYLEVNGNSKRDIENFNKKIQDLEYQQKYMYTELTNKEARIKNMSTENKNLQHLAESTEKSLREASIKITERDTLLQKANLELNNKIQELETVMNHNYEKGIKIEVLTKKVSELELQLSNEFLELTEKENVVASLLMENKTLQEKLSKTDDYKEKELLDVEQKIKNARQVVQSLEIELNSLKQQVNNSNDELHQTSSKISQHMDVISNGNRELFRAFSLVANKWQLVLDKNLKFKNLPSIKLGQFLDITNGLLCLRDNINIVVLLLEILSSKAPISMENSKEQFLNCDPKTVKKFTLRPPRLVINRPVSPDSPNLEIDESSVICHQEVCFNGLKENKNSNSPDSQRCEELSTGSESDLENRLSNDFPSPCLDLPFEDAFPHLSDSFLEAIGLHEGSSKQKLTNDQTEKLFTTFAIQIALDSRDIKERLQKQKELCKLQHKKCYYLIKDISLRLRDHRCIGASDPINPVFVLLEDVRYLLQEIIQSSGKLGILTCESRMVKCWNLVTNYMALLKQNIGNCSPLSKRNQHDKAVETNKLQVERMLHEEDQISPLIAKEAIHMEGYRSTFLRNTKRVLIWTVFSVFLVFVGLITIHWQCQMTTEHQICPLDDFIKKIRVGNPPY